MAPATEEGRKGEDRVRPLSPLTVMEATLVIGTPKGANQNRSPVHAVGMEFKG